MSVKTDETKMPTGLGVDSHGGPVVDPTANVIALVIAEGKRQDGNLEALTKYLESKIQCLEEKAELREKAAEQLRETETKRVDAVRQVDQLAVTTAAERSQAAVSALAATTASNAENVRAALTANEAKNAAQLANTVSQINERIATLERASYEGKGKSAVADPALDRMAALVEKLTAAQASGAGRSDGGKAMWGYVVGALGLVALLMGIYSSLSDDEPQSEPAPQVIYVPAPAGALLPTTPPQSAPR